MRDRSWGKPRPEGWLYRDGRLGRLVHVKRRVARESLLPETIDLAAEDEFGRPLQLHRTFVASCPWQAWGNFNANISLMRWESAGGIAYGDCQEPMWNDYCNFIAAR